MMKFKCEKEVKIQIMINIFNKIGKSSVFFYIKLQNKVVIQNKGKLLYQSTKAKIGKSGNARLIRWRRNLHLDFRFRH